MNRNAIEEVLGEQFEIRIRIAENNANASMDLSVMIRFACRIKDLIHEMVPLSIPCNHSLCLCRAAALCESRKVDRLATVSAQTGQVVEAIRFHLNGRVRVFESARLCRVALMQCRAHVGDAGRVVNRLRAGLLRSSLHRSE